MFERILIPLDGSSIGETALHRIGPMLTSGRVEKLLLLHAVDAPTVLIDPEYLLGLRSEAREYLDDIATRLELSSGEIVKIVHVGLAAESVLQYAADKQATLIAMSTHGRSGLDRWALGSVAEKVLRAADIPLWIARATDGQAEPAAPRRVLVPTDGSERSLALLPQLVALKEAFDCEMTLLRVVGAGASASDTEAEQALRQAAARLAESGLQTRTEIVEGAPAEMILQHAEGEGFELIAMSTHGRSGFSRWLLGSVAEKVLRAASLPVLVVPDAARTRA